MHKQTAKFIGVVAQNLPEISDALMQNWIENPKGLQKVLKNALCPPETMPNFEIFKTIKLGIGPRNADEFRKDIKESGMKIGDWADGILSKPKFTSAIAIEEIEVDLVVKSVAELGFEDGATREQIYTRAEELGLGLCPNEVGPQLRLQYKDQPKGELLIIAMKPITVSVDNLRLFIVGHNIYGLWLYGDYGNPNNLWGSDCRFVFVLPRK